MKNLKTALVGFVAFVVFEVAVVALVLWICAGKGLTAAGAGRQLFFAFNLIGGLIACGIAIRRWESKR